MDIEKLLEKFFPREVEPIVSIDIGSSKIKAMVLDVGSGKPQLRAAGLTPTPANSLKNNIVTNPEHVGAAIRSLIDANEISIEKAAIAVPGPTAFTKRVTIPRAPLKQLEQTMKFEAGNFIPHSVSDVYLDFQVLGESGSSNLDVMIVAVKNEVVQSYVAAIEAAGLVPGIVDVDFFALENMFELNYPQYREQMVALVDIGARFSTVCIVHEGKSLVTGDVSVGGRLYTDALCEALSMTGAQAEEAKQGREVEGFTGEAIAEILERTTEHVASEIHRQLGFFWNASGANRPLEAIYVSGGAIAAHGLIESLTSLTGIDCQAVDPFKEIEWSENFDTSYLQEIRNYMGISVGLAVRRLGDKQHAVTK